MKKRNRPAEKLIPGLGIGASDENDLSLIQVRLHLPGVIAFVLDDTGHHEPFSGLGCNLDSFFGSLVVVDSPEKQEVLARPRLKGEVLDVDPVMNCSQVI